MNSRTPLAPLPSKLRSYQMEGVNFLLRQRGAVLADEMGLGKTATAITALSYALAPSRTSRALVVTPSSLLSNWTHEFDLWAPRLVVRQVRGEKDDRHYTYRLPIQVLLASYEIIRSDISSLTRLSFRFSIVLLDEAQRAKNMDSSTNLALRRIKRDRVWALTATPIENRPEDLASIFRLAVPGKRISAQDTSSLKSLARSYVLRRTKQQVESQLPPIIHEYIYLSLTEQQGAEYHNAWTYRRESLRSYQESTSLFALLTRLKQICNFASQGASVKAEYVEHLVEQEGPPIRLIVFSQYVETLRTIGHRLSLPTTLYHGGLSQEERARALEWFRSTEPPAVILMSLKAGGVGLNIKEASHVVLFDLWWNPATHAQAIARAHRLDRRMPLYAATLVTAGTVEERIVDILHEKSGIAADIIPTADTGLTTSDLGRILDITGEKGK